jgi:inorganic triphosphatase YgiF
MPSEVEARFRPLRGTALAELTDIAQLGTAELGPPRSFAEVDIYLDTPAGELAAARWACRLRRRADRLTVSLKGPPDGPVTDAIHRRPEVEGPATPSLDPAAWPPSPARDLLDRLRGAAPIVERLTLEQDRTERLVTLDGRALATLSLDAVTVRRAGRARGSFAVVELELAPDAADREPMFRRVAAELHARADLVPDPQTKLEHALELTVRG